jgi:hypothetical protein
MAVAGGVPPVTESIYIRRKVTIDERYDPSFQRREAPFTPPQPEAGDIESLIEQLDRPGGGEDDGGAGQPQNDEPRPGMLPQETQAPPVDVDDLAPRRVAEEPDQEVPALRDRSDNVNPEAGRQDSFIYVNGEWVRVRSGEAGQDIVGDVMGTGEEPLIAERIIEIAVKDLLSDSRYNVVIRPGDEIYVSPPLQGVIYIRGEVFRPGVYNLPVGGRLTLNRLISAAGGFAPLAMPDRVDLIRRLGDHREATIRVNLRAIANRTEPDIYLKPDDSIIVGTSFIASPLAVIRNGFRMTYGFGFLLDRNFGNDVFGAPPTNRFGE